MNEPTRFGSLRTAAVAAVAHRGRRGMLALIVGLTVLAATAPLATPADAKRGQCSDGRDNDRDGTTDTADPGCKNGRDRSEINKSGPACDNGRDDDGDGTIDEGGGKKKKRKPRGTADAGCEGPTDTDEGGAAAVTACSDGVDNEPDGRVDAFDPGCSSAADTTETNRDGPECDNGIDDDEDGRSDFRINDTGDGACESVFDDDERQTGGSGGGGGDGGGDVDPGDGDGNPPPPPPSNKQLQCSPEAINFGDVPLFESRTRTVTCTASGAAGETVTVSQVVLSGSDEYSRLPGGCLGDTLAVGASCTETIRFRPESGGQENAVLTISHDGTNPAETVTIAGNGFLQQG